MNKFDLVKMKDFCEAKEKEREKKKETKENQIK